MLGFPILYVTGSMVTMFQLSGFYSRFSRFSSFGLWPSRKLSTALRNFRLRLSVAGACLLLG